MTTSTLELWDIGPGDASVVEVLGARMGCNAADLTFTTNPYGKRQLSDSFELRSNTDSLAPFGKGGSVHFSVTHTQGRSLVGLASSPVGIDIERADRDVDVVRAGRLVLTPTEREHLHSLDHGQQRRAYLGLWTRKEAVAKGVGLGLHLPFRTIDTLDDTIVVGPELAGEHGVPGVWHLEDVNLGSGYVTAVALHESKPEVAYRSWNGRYRASALAPSAKGEIAC